MSYIEIINNSEKYIEMLKQKDKIYIKYSDITRSDDLVKRSDPLFGYYDVKCFTINKIEFNPDDLFLNYKVICGDFFCGEGFLKKIDKKNSSKEWFFNEKLVK
jgi:hypothetical protein